MFMVECNLCHQKTFTASGTNACKALECGCCPENHDHTRSANETGVICRPVTIHLLPGSASLKVM